MGSKFKISESEHPFLRFNRHTEGTGPKTSIENWREHKEIAVAPAINWDRLTEIGIYEQLRPFFIRTYTNTPMGDVDDNSWDNMVRVHEPVYMELTLEFLATFKYQGEDLPTDIRFRLMEHWYNVSLAQFAGLLGLYSEEFTSHPSFSDYLKTFAKGSYNSQECDSFFRGIANATTPRDNSAGQIRDPRFRMLHRLLCFTVLHSGGFDKVPYSDMYPLWGAITPEAKVHLPHLFACFFRDKAKGSTLNSPLCGGHFITRIAKNVLGGIPQDQRTKMKLKDPRILTESHFKSMVRKISSGVYGFVDPLPVQEFAPEPQPEYSQQYMGGEEQGGQDGDGDDDDEDTD